MGTRGKGESVKIILTITAEMHQALKKVSEETGIPMARLVRMSVSDKLESHGVELQEKITWGGARKNEVDDEGQSRAA